MKPAPFVYVDPETLDEAVALLAEHGDDALVLAGGQSLVPLLNMRLARPAVVVDPRRVAGLDAFEAGAAGVRCGALARAADVEHDTGVAATMPGLVEAIGQVGHPQIRNRTTIGGSIAHADPAAELPAVLAALGGRVTLASATGTRTVDADDFFDGPFQTTRRSDELVTEVTFPAFDGPTTIVEVARRPGDFAMAGTFCGLRTVDGVVVEARIALFGVADRPVRAAEAEALLVGRTPSPDAWVDAATLATAALRPADDVHASGAYRRSVAGVAVERALARLSGTGRQA